MKTFIIAEAGVNHNGSMEIARRLIDEAKAAGSDAIKFQTFKARKLVSRKADKAPYQKETTSRDESQYDMLKRLELGEQEHFDLISLCKEKGIIFLSSPFDEESADLLEKIGVNMFKIPSGEITNLPFLQHIARKNKPLIMSTGMATLEEVEEALNSIYTTGNKRVTLLHCVTEYPAPFAEINLRAMLTMKKAFNLPVGYSDHTPGIEIAIAAVSLGAEVIEKHFTLDKNMEGPDHKASIEPHELRQMIRSIRNVENSLGDGVKRPAPCELKNMEIARKSIVAAELIKRGQPLTKKNVVIKRPGYGVQPKDMEKILGRIAKSDIHPDEVVTWEKLS